MSTPEDFRRHLSRVLARKNQSIGGKAVEAEAVKEAAAETLETNNKKVAEIDLRLPIKGILSVFREEAGIAEPIKEWGPENGQISYSLIYQSGITQGRSSRGRGDPGAMAVRWCNTIGIVFNSLAELEIRLYTPNRVGGSMKPLQENDFNPFLWENYLYENLHKNGDTSSGNMFWLYSKIPYGPLFNVGSKKGVQQFALTLANFYVGLKIGQGK